eukprot:scaffold89396_cov66-Phaeocystis_antarctica.AAC.1
MVFGTKVCFSNFKRRHHQNSSNARLEAKAEAVPVDARLRLTARSLTPSPRGVSPPYTASLCQASRRTRSAGPGAGGLKLGRALGDAPGEPALSLASTSPSSEELEQRRCTCSSTVLERLGSCPCACAALSLSLQRRPKTIASTAADICGPEPRGDPGEPGADPGGPTHGSRSAPPAAECSSSSPGEMRIDAPLAPAVPPPFTVPPLTRAPEGHALLGS